MKPVAWLLYKGGELYTVKLEKDDRGDFYTWKPLYTAGQLREVEQQRDELLAALQQMQNTTMSFFPFPDDKMPITILKALTDSKAAISKAIGE